MEKRIEYELFRRGNTETGRYHEINMGRGDRALTNVSFPTEEKCQKAIDSLWELAKRLGGDYEYAIKQTTTILKTEWIDC